MPHTLNFFSVVTPFQKYCIKCFFYLQEFNNLIIYALYDMILGWSLLFQTEVVVNITSENLHLTNGRVSRAILKLAGNTIQKECKEVFLLLPIYSSSIYRAAYSLVVVSWNPGRIIPTKILHFATLWGTEY
jgi:hypothetical protein